MGLGEPLNSAAARPSVASHKRRVPANDRADLNLEGLKGHEGVGMSALSSKLGVNEVLGNSLVWLPRGAAASITTPLTT